MAAQAKLAPAPKDVTTNNSEAASSDAKEKEKDFLRRKNDLYLRKVAALEAEGKSINAHKRQALFDEADYEVWLEMGGGSSRKRARQTPA